MKEITFKTERRLWMIAVGILIPACAGLTFLWRHEFRENRALYKQGILEKDIDLLEERLEAVKSQDLRKIEFEALKSKGLKTPFSDLASNLQHHPELIPYKAAPGYRMTFSGPDRIRILSARWAVADFKDNLSNRPDHAKGRVLLKYWVSAKGKISWKVIDSHLFPQ